MAKILLCSKKIKENYHGGQKNKSHHWYLMRLILKLNYNYNPMNKYETEKSDINQYNILWKIQIDWSNTPRSFVNSKSDYNPQRT